MKKILAIATVLVLAGCGSTAPTSPVHTTPMAVSSSPSPNNSSTAIPSSSAPVVEKTDDGYEGNSGDVGSGTPGAYCATSRLGKTFKKNGVTYTCKGPKPYRWRR